MRPHCHPLPTSPGFSLHLLRGGAERGERSPGDREDPGIDDAGEREWLHCITCRHRITTAADRVAMGGGHEHTFFNPHGVVFHLGCFRHAPGCASAGPPSREFSWFAGYQWLLTFCIRCRNHLGWRFQGGTEGPFFGLILNRITDGSGE